ELVFVTVVVVIGAVLRLYLLDSAPAGFNQDEASIGYDSWAIANFGMDRNGYHFPVYPVAWGAGHGPLYTYIAAIFIKIFGLSPLVYRLPVALMGVASLPVFHLLLKKLHSRLAGYIGLTFLAIMPWHVMLSRWGLDSNPLPFVVLVAVYLLVLAEDNQKTGYFVASSIFFTLSLYCYGAAMVTVPVLLMIMVPYLLYHKKLPYKALLWSGAAFIVVVAPLFVFYCINIFKLPEIMTPFFSIPRLTVLRSASIFIAFDGSFLINVLKNLNGLIMILTVGAQDLIWNAVPGFNTAYVFTFPLMILGLYQSFKRAKELRKFSAGMVMCAWFSGSCLLALLIAQNINRLSILFIPQAYFIAIGLLYLADNYRRIFSVSAVSVIVAAMLFTSNYFGAYNKDVGTGFMQGFGDAIRYADSLQADKIYVTTNGLNGGYILTMFFLETPPQEFIDTVVYTDPNAQFRNAESFGRFIFHLEGNMTDEAYYNDTFLVNAAEVGYFSPDIYNIKVFDHFAVVHKK
ncbi:MAG: hypothetical protein HGA22_11895, partial [Clostridiales bacterium]|nr:hypothetical protein [Clostridiales bacterium]